MTGKMKTTVVLAFAMLAALPLAALQQPPVPKPDYAKLVGSWALEVNAGGEFYYLTLEFKLVEGRPEGAVSEQNGFFTNIPVAAIEWDNTVLKFEFKSVTPPDGVERQVKAEFKLVEPRLEGMMTIPELGMSVPVTGIKK